MFCFLEIDYKTLHRDSLKSSRPLGARMPSLSDIEDQVIISFIQPFDSAPGCPFMLQRFSLRLPWDQIHESRFDPSSLRVLVEYEHDLFQQFGIVRISDVTFCTASYVPNANETVQIYQIPELLSLDQRMQSVYSS